MSFNKMRFEFMIEELEGDSISYFDLRILVKQNLPQEHSVVELTSAVQEAEEIMKNFGYLPSEYAYQKNHLMQTGVIYQKRSDS